MIRTILATGFILGMGIASLFSQTPIEEAAALLAAKKPEEALAKLEATPKESEWYFKSRFLKARILTEQKKHEPAAQIYAEEAARLFDPKRKDSLAKSLSDFADELCKTDGPETKPDFPAALNLYQRAIVAEISPSLKAEIHWKMISAARAGNLHPQALQFLQSYLSTYDADWMLQAQGQTIPPAKVEETHRYEARIQLVETLRALNKIEEAKRNVEHILRLAKGEDAKSKEIAGDAAWLKILLRDPRRQAQNNNDQQIQLPAVQTSQGQQGDIGPKGEAGEKGGRMDYEPWTPLSAYRNFLKDYPKHKHAPEAAREVARLLTEDGKLDAALVAWNEFIEGKIYQFVENEATLKQDPKTGKSAVDQLNAWKQEAVFAIGQLLLQQRKHTEAIAAFQKYVTQFPNGAQWAAAQSAIIDAEFQLGLQAVSVNDEKLARERFEAFLTKYPLDQRAPQVLFIYGQFPYAEALHLETEKAPAATLEPLFKNAITTWERLLNKYPTSEQASLALYNTAVIQAEKFGKLEDSLATFKRVTWGNWESLAKSRAALLSERSLTLATERSFRTNEKVIINTAVRNIQKLRFSQYALNLEAYFRKQHKLEGIDLLDLDLIEPDKTWETPVNGYEKFKGIEQKIDVPFPDGKPGVCVIRADGEDWQAATLVIRSDIDIIVQAASKELLVFVVDRIKNVGVPEAEVLVSDGTKIIATGKSGADGVFRTLLEKGYTTESLGVFAKSPQGVALQNLSVAGLACSGELKSRAAIYTEKTNYLPGQLLHFRMKLREPVAGKLTTPVGKLMKLNVLGLEARLLQEQSLKLDEFGMATGTFQIPAQAPPGTYKLRFEEAEKSDSQRYEAAFIVVSPKPETIRLAVQFAKRWVLRGEKITGTVSATDAWGEPIRNEPLHLTLPDGRVIRQTTNQEGVFTFEFDPAGFDIESSLKFTAALVNKGVQQVRAIPVLDKPYSIAFSRDSDQVIAGVPFQLKITAQSPDQQFLTTELQLEVLKNAPASSHRVLEGVPWISYQPTEIPPQVVQTRAIKTTDKSSGLTESLTIAEAGSYQIRISGKDDLGRPIEELQSFQAFGEKDPIKLAFISGDTKAAAGGIAKLNLHSRLATPLALLSVHGDRFVSHKIITLKAGVNPLEIAVGKDFTAVQVTVITLDGTAQHMTQKGITVDHALKVELVAAADGTQKITVADASGKPVKAVTQETWIHESQSEGVTLISTDSQHTNPQIASASSAGFRHQASPKRVNREAADQKDRFIAAKSDQEQLLETQQAELRLNPTNSVLVSNYSYNFNNNGYVQITQQQALNGNFSNGLNVTNLGQGIIIQREFPYPTDFDPPQIPQSFGGATTREEINWTFDSMRSSETIAARHFYVTRIDATEPATQPNLRRTLRAFTTGMEEGILISKSEIQPPAPAISLEPTARVEGDKATTQQRTERAKYADSKVEATPDQPWGLRTDLFAGGLLNQGDTILKVTIPADQKAILSIRTEEHISDFLTSLAMRKDASLGNALLNTLVALPGKPELMSQATTLVAALAATQKDGGWTWQGIPSLASDTISTSTAYWALVEAKRANIPVSEKMLERAEKSLISGYAGIPADDNEKKAVVLHALAVAGKADFSNCNRLYRERESLSETSLAFMAAAFVRMDRPELANDLLVALAKKAVATKSFAGQDLTQWPGSSKVSRLSEPELTTAMALWAFGKLDRANKLAVQSAAFLLHSRSVAETGSHRNSGPVAVALAEFFKGQPSIAIPEVTILIDDKSATSGATLVAGEHRITLRSPIGGRLYRAVISQFDAKWTDPHSFDKPAVASRTYLHESYQYASRPLKAASSSPVAKAEFGQRINVELKFTNGATPYPGFIVLEESLPAGCYYVPGSVKGNYSWAAVEGNKLLLTFPPGTLEPVTYQMAALVPGEFRVAPTLIRDAHKPGEFRVGKEMKLTILKPGQKTDEGYKLNPQEHFELANLTFADGKYEETFPHLETLFNDAKQRESYERELARMMLWVLASRPQPDTKRLVDVFELLSERHPDLVVPFDKILVVAEAYRKLGEFERSSMAFAAATDGGFINDAGLSSVLEPVDFIGSIEFQERLWKEYPDAEDEIGAHFALAQTLFKQANQAEKLAVKRGKPKLEKAELLRRSKELVQQFIRMYPLDDNADDAAFSLVNVFFALKDYPNVVVAAEAGAKAHPTSRFQNSFQYMAALGHFWQFHYDQALASAAPVANGESKDRDYARYITAQIHHAQGKGAEAIAWYEKVASLYPDAKAALSYFQDREISLPEITTFKPGEKVQVKIEYRNLKDVALQIYRVDLMRLYLREKNLSNVTAVNLAGIAPESELVSALGDGKDFDVKKDKGIELPIKDAGAYLVIARGDDHFTSGLVLITPLKLDIQEEPTAGSLRVNVKDAMKGGFVADAEVKAIGSGSKKPEEGTTDPRGLFEATNLNGAATVIVRSKAGHYAFFRGSKQHGVNASPAQSNGLQRRRMVVPNQSDYLKNVEDDNAKVQSGNIDAWSEKKANAGKGVQLEKVRKK